MRSFRQRIAVLFSVALFGLAVLDAASAAEPDAKPQTLFKNVHIFDDVNDGVEVVRLFGPTEFFREAVLPTIRCRECRKFLFASKGHLCPHLELSSLSSSGLAERPGAPKTNRLSQNHFFKKTQLRLSDF